MDKWINELLETHLGRIIDKSRDELILSDEICHQIETDLSESEARYMALDLSKSDRMFINEYITCLQTADHRIADLSYMAGVRDTVRLLHSLTALKDIEL